METLGSFTTNSAYLGDGQTECYVVLPGRKNVMWCCRADRMLCSAAGQKECYVVLPGRQNVI